MRSVISRCLPLLTLALFVTSATVGTFAGGLWAGIGIGGAIILFIATWILDRRLPKPDSRLIALAVGALAVMAIMNNLSFDPARSWHEWIKLASIFLPLLLLSNPSLADHARPANWTRILLVAASVGAAALGAELYAGGPLLHAIKGPNAFLAEYNRGFSHLILLSFPIMAGLWVSGRRRWIVPLILLLLVPAGLTESRASKLALIVGLPVAYAASLWPQAVRRLLMAATVLLAGWAFAAQQFFLHATDWLKHFPPSWYARMEIWDYMSYRIMDRPWTGWGLGTSGTLDYTQPHGADYVYITAHPASHPHNMLTQLWVELGLPGLVIGFAFAALTLHRIGKLDSKTAPFATGAWAAALILSLVAYNFWTDSLFAAFALTGFGFAMIKAQDGNAT